MSVSHDIPLSRWHFWIDRGGTFTDVVARAPDGRLLARKVLSRAVDDGAAVVSAIRGFLEVPDDAPLPAERIAEIRVGTTVATNALLVRAGAPVLLVVTRGHRDAFRIGYQSRPELFALHVRRPEPLYDRIVEVDERIGAEGTIVSPLDEAGARRDLDAAFRDGHRACAIALLHADRYPEHEARLAAIARAVGFDTVVTSHETGPLLGFVARGHTAVADAYLTPILRTFVSRLQSRLPGVPVLWMQSNGGLVDGHLLAGRNAVLSGPAGGAVAVEAVARSVGASAALGFDMGGTSTDVCHWGGRLERRDDTDIGGVRLRTPMVAVHTVAAGGGSIVRFDGGRLRVGPDSAGADPGPACYRRGGPATVTDANLLLGRLQADAFPAVFGASAAEPPDLAAARTRFEELARDIGAVTGRRVTPESVARDALDVAVTAMAAATRRVSVERGHDITDHRLVAFGSAGGQHACAIAAALGVSHVVVPPLAGVLSAYGIGLARRRVVLLHSVEMPLDVGAEEFVTRSLEAALGQADEELRAQGDPPGESFRRVRLRYEGTSTPLAVDIEAASRHRSGAAGCDASAAVAWRAAFEDEHRRRFGYVDPERGVVVDSIEVERTGAPPGVKATVAPAPLPPLSPRVRLFDGGAWRDVPRFARADLAVDAPIVGPALVVDADGCVVVESGWSTRVDAGQHLHLVRDRGVIASTAEAVTAAPAAPDPARVEIFGQLFCGIAEQMGLALQQTAQSVNIRERLDFSCALFDAEGELVANAPHIPVHLGSMGDTVRAVRRRIGTAPLHPGDAWLHNDPYDGGTHLPDLTVVSPVFDAAGAVRAWVASRGHHADVGGSTPGSVSPESTTIDEEGVLFRGFPLVTRGGFEEAALRARLAEGPWPARSPDQNVADLRAQLAANAAGAEALQALLVRHGPHTIARYLAWVQDDSERAVRAALQRLAPRSGTFTVPIDGGGQIAVTVTISEDGDAVVDFTGTSPERRDNANAPPAIVRAAVLYVVRTLVDEDVPLNAGCLRPIRIVIPEGSMLAPKPPAAVVAGNVETSQWICDALYGALGVLAASQGTMNNLTFADARRQYYETICGGTGAGNGFDGCAAIHSHMTNSRLTDPEVLETRLPVRVERFGVRSGTGGAGRFRGGDGAVRILRFLEPVTCSILSSRRETEPFGLEGGAPGARGRNAVLRAEGNEEPLGGRARVAMAPGDAIVIETPGGGGYGSP
jgi:5-oxoprolinase (ATP-hydrolysing)